MPLRWYRSAFTLTGRRLRIPAARGHPPLRVRLDRDLPYPPEQVRSVTLLYDAGRLWVGYRRQIRRRDHAGHSGRCNAPPRWGAPAWCYPLAT